MNTVFLKKKFLYKIIFTILSLQYSQMGFGMDTKKHNPTPTNPEGVTPHLIEHMIKTSEEHRVNFNIPLAEIVEEILDKTLTRGEDAQIADKLQNTELISIENRGSFPSYVRRPNSSQESSNYNLTTSLTKSTFSLSEVAFLAHATGERYHPNEGNALLTSVNKIIESNEYIDLSDFNSKVYTLINVNNEPNFRYVVDKVEIGRSNILLFWLICNKIPNRISVINKCASEIYNLKDSKGNNILHIASLYGDGEIIGSLFTGNARGKIPNDVFPRFINHRNKDGTNPLGMVFLNPSNALNANEKIINISSYFTYRRDFKINSYLNNKKGMDYQSKEFLNQIGGYNCLHMACTKRDRKLLNLLKIRNESWKVDEVPPEYFVNFIYPSLNPDNHMTSPKLLLVTSRNRGNMEEILRELEELEKKQLQNENEDESGDSDDEESHAYTYKKSLLTFNKLIEQAATSIQNGNTKHQEYIDYLNNNDKSKTEEFKQEAEDFHANIVIPHFHGVPFMQGQYKNYQRRAVVKKLFEINGRKIENLLNEEKELGEKDNILVGLHSRTSTASNGIDNMYDLMNADEDTLSDVDKTDQELKLYLSTCYKDDSKNFLTSLEQYLFYFSDNPIGQFWNPLEKSTLSENAVKYRFPFISTSKAPDHAIKFGVGLNTETHNRGERPLFPYYNQHGFPKHRLAGLLYISFHTISELHDMQRNHQIADVTQLFKSDQISGRGDIRIVPQAEVDFFGGISGDNIVAVIPIFYPNFYDKKTRKPKLFNMVYHSQIWDFENNSNFNKKKDVFKDNEEHHKDFKTYFHKPYQRSNGGTGSNTTNAYKTMMSSYVKLALQVSQSIATLKNKHLAYIDPKNDITRYLTTYDESKIFSQVQISIKDVLPGSSSPPHMKQKISRGSLTQETNEMKFSIVVKQKLDFLKKAQLEIDRMQKTPLISENGQEFYEELISGKHNACALYCLGFESHQDALILVNKKNSPEMRHLVISEIRADAAQGGIIFKQEEYKKLDTKIKEAQINLNRKINELKDFINTIPTPDKLSKEFEQYNILYQENNQAELNLTSYLSSEEVFKCFTEDTIQKGKMLSYLPEEGATGIINLLAKLKMKNLCIYGKNQDNKLSILHQYIWDEEKPLINLIHTQYKDEYDRKIIGGVPGTLLENHWNHFNLLLED